MGLKVKFYHFLKRMIQKLTVVINNQLFFPQQKRFNVFLGQIKKEHNDISMRLFSKCFSCGRPDEMLEDLYNSKSSFHIYNKLVQIHWHFDYIANRAKKMPPSTNTNEFVKILNIVNEILKFNEQIRWGQGLKILTPSQTLSRLPISLAQLKARNNAEKLKSEIRLLYSLCRSKKLTKTNL